MKLQLLPLFLLLFTSSLYAEEFKPIRGGVITLDEGLNSRKPLAFKPEVFFVAKENTFIAEIDKYLVSYNHNWQANWRVPLSEGLTTPPSFDEESLYIATKAGTIQKYSLSLGKLLWTSSKSDSFFTRNILTGLDMVIGLSSQQTLYFMDKNGQVTSSLELAKPQQTVVSPLAPMTRNLGELYIGGASGQLYCVDLEKKNILWSHRPDDKLEFPEIIGDINVTNRKITFAHYSSSVKSIEVDATTTVKTLWEQTDINGNISAFTSRGNQYYLGTTSGFIYIGNIATGAILSKFQLGGTINWLRPAESTLMAATVDGKIAHFTDTLKLNWADHLTNTIKPVIIKNQVFVLSAFGNLYNYFLKF